MLSKQTKKG